MVRPLTRRLITIAVAGAGVTVLMAAPVPAFATPPAVAGNVNTGDGPLNVRAGASPGTTLLDRVPDGTPVTIACQVAGTRVNGNNLWDRIGAGRYVTDAYIMRDRSVTVANCVSPLPPAPSVPPRRVLPDQRAAPLPGTVHSGNGPVNVRTGPSTGMGVVYRVPDGTPITIECQVAGDAINGNPLWDRIGAGRYVADAYVRHSRSLQLPTCDWVRPPGTWVVPVPGVVGQRFRPASNPNHDGVDIMEPRNTPIRATSDGTVITVECNTSGPSCNVDGSPSTYGCGWYVEILHPGQVITRYCHLVRQPNVSVGQRVLTGVVIGYVGTSGNSSGTHLHFEVHAGGRRADRGNAVDPVAFMRSVNAPLSGT